MSRVLLDLSMSIDGYIAGLGGEDAGLHAWIFNGAIPVRGGGMTFRGESEQSAAVFAEVIERAGAFVVGRRTFAAAGEKPLFQRPTFVLTHQPRAAQAEAGAPITFIIGGIEQALTQARAVAGEQDVIVFGGAQTAQQYLRAGLVDELRLTLVPVLLGAGLRLFEQGDTQPITLERTRVVESTRVTHMSFRIVR